VDLVDKEDVALLQVGKQRGKIASLGDHRARRRTKIDPELARHDLCEGGFSKARRPDEQHVIERLATPACRFDENGQV